MIKAWFDGYRESPAELGYEPDPGEDRLVASRSTSAETDEQAHRGGRRPIGGTSKVAAQPPGACPAARLHVGVAAHRADEGTPLPNFDLRRGARSTGGYIIVGSPSTVAERIHALQETLGFGQLGANIPVGTVSQQQTRESTDAFAKEVIPLFREKTAPVAT